MYNFIKQYARDDFEWGVAPFPASELLDHPVTIIETNALMIPYGVKNPRHHFVF